MPLTWRKTSVLVLKILVSLLVLWVVAHSLPLHQLIEAFAHLQWGWLIAAVMAMAVEFVSTSAKLGWMAGDTSLLNQLKIACVKIFASHLLPGGVGGDAARIVFLTARIQSSGRATAIIFEDRWSGLCGQLIGSGLAILIYRMNHHLESPWTWFWQATSAAMLLTGMAGWFLGPYFMARMASGMPWLPKRGFFRTLQEESKSFSAEMDGWSRWTRRSLPLLGWSFLCQISRVCLLLAMSRALGSTIHPLLGFPIMLLGAMAIVIPLSIGSLGIQEGLFALGFQLAGHNAEIGLGVSLLFRVILLLPLGLGFYFFMKGTGFSSELKPAVS